MKSSRVASPALLMMLSVIVVVAGCTTHALPPALQKSAIGNAAMNVEWNCFGGAPKVREGAPEERYKSVTHRGFVVIYDRHALLPLSVSHRVTFTMLSGSWLKRAGLVFHQDSDLGQPQAKSIDYQADLNGVGFQRGHLAASADYSIDRGLMDESFQFSNVAPQRKDFNIDDDKPWKLLENATRSWVERHGDVFVIAGASEQGTQSRPAETIGADHVAVPRAFYKVIVWKDIGGTWRVSCYVIPHVYARDSSGVVRLSMCKATLTDVERMIGLTLFPTKSPMELREMQSAATNEFHDFAARIGGQSSE